MAMSGKLCLEQRIIRTSCYVLWTYKFTYHFSNDDEPPILRLDQSRKSGHLYGQYHDLYNNN